MICEDALWPAILECRRYIQAAIRYGNHRAARPVDSSTRKGLPGWLFQRNASGHWQFFASEHPEGWSVEAGRVCCDLRSPMPKAFTDQLGLSSRYVQLLIDQYHWTEDRPMTIGSVAQSLDGFIATLSGDSQWIGNQQNLVHAHRLRALHDGILVGRRTLERDRPALTVRHVSGDNPRRIVLTTQCPPPASLLEALSGPTLVVQPGNRTPDTQSLGKDAQLLDVDCDGDDPQTRIIAILQALWREGVRSILVEGGGETLSLLHRTGNLDGADLQIAPILLGQGIRALEVGPVTTLKDAPKYDTVIHGLGHQALMCVSFQGCGERV